MDQMAEVILRVEIIKIAALRQTVAEDAGERTILRHHADETPQGVVQELHGLREIRIFGNAGEMALHALGHRGADVLPDRGEREAGLAENPSRLNVRLAEEDRLVGLGAVGARPQARGHAGGNRRVGIGALVACHKNPAGVAWGLLNHVSDK